MSQKVIWVDKRKKIEMKEKKNFLFKIYLARYLAIIDISYSASEPSIFGKRVEYRLVAEYSCYPLIIPSSIAFNNLFKL